MHHSKVTWGIFLVFALLVTFILLASIQRFELVLDTSSLSQVAQVTDVQTAPEPPPPEPQGTCEAQGGAKCYYVATDGLDTNAGTFAAPYKTFAPALAKTKPGDIVYARGGKYTIANTSITGYNQTSSKSAPCTPVFEANLNGKCHGLNRAFIPLKDWSYSGTVPDLEPKYTIPNGTAGNPITVKAYPGENPVFDRGAQQGTGVNISEKWYWVIDGFEMKGEVIYIWGGLTTARNTHDITIRNNEIHSVAATGGNNPGAY